MNDKMDIKFCRLCGKNKPATEFFRTPLARIAPDRVFGCEVCKSCQTVVHNIRTLVRDADNNYREEMKQKAEAAPRMIVPPTPDEMAKLKIRS